jgi:hypothetical protein
MALQLKAAATPEDEENFINEFNALSVSVMPPVGSFWKHYKGNCYEIVGMGLTEATLEPTVIYRDVSGKYNFYWTRALSAWQSLTDDGQPRFVRDLEMEALYAK